MPRGLPGFVIVTEAVRTPALDGMPTLSADEYLEGRGDALAKDLVVINLCRSYQYLSKGYYVSLLADARHQRVFPSLKVIEEVRHPATYLRALREAGLEIADPRALRESRRASLRVAGANGDAAEAKPTTGVQLELVPEWTNTAGNGRGNGNGHADDHGHDIQNGNGHGSGNGNGQSNGNGRTITVTALQAGADTRGGGNGQSNGRGNGHGNGNGHATGNGRSNGNGHAKSNGSSPVPEPAPALLPGYSETWCVFGKTVDERFRRHCASVFKTYPFPLLKVRLLKDEGCWKVGQIAPVTLAQLDPAELDLLGRELSRPQFIAPRRANAGPRPYRIACLWDAEDPFAASDRETLDRLARIAARRTILLERIEKDDLQRLAEYDALFIRSVTAIDHYSFTFAQTAESLGIPVIDDPQSIIKCTNKVYLQELFRRNGIATPRTVTISRKTPFDEVRPLGFPLIVKLPDGTFSQSVKRADDATSFEAITQEMFKRSPLLIVQEFIPTAFDWRIGVLEGRVLFVCKYHMARGHWQIVTLTRDGERAFGKVEAVRTAEVPPEVLRLALESTALLGNGLYGVDVKETPGGPVVIEINDNPNIQTGYEDGVEKDRVYEALLDTFVARIRSRAVAPEERA